VLQKHCEQEASDMRLQYKRGLPPKIGVRLLKGKNLGLIAQAIQQVFPLCQPANQSWRLELPSQRDSSFQSPQPAGSWELE
jgi:hypothetical protein